MPQPLPDPSLPWPIVLEGVYLIATAEALMLNAYRCPAGVPSIGWGETDGVKMGDTCTKEQADRWLCDDLTDRARAVRDLCTMTPSQHELAAMVSFAYNVGLGGLKTSSVLRCHNAGDHAGAARAFSLWNKARDPQTGQLRELAGLTRRRAAEAALYLTPDGDAREPMPQAVEPESSLAASPISRGGAVTIGSGVLATASAAADELKDASDVLGKFHGIAAQVADYIGVPPVVLLGIVLVAAGVMVMRWRSKQRQGGWA
jgi:lysozyme